MTILAIASTSKIENNAMNVLDKTPKPLGVPYSLWESIAVKLMFAGAVLGILALAASLASSFILYLTSGHTKAETDRKVTEAHDTGLEAGKRAGHAQAGVDEGKVELAKQTTLTAEANARAVEAGARAEEAGERTEQLRSVNVRMQAALKPRRLVFGSRNDDGPIRTARFNEVGKYAGMVALIQVVPDFEARTLAGDIVKRLTDAGWRVFFTDEAASHIPSGLIWEGVRVMSLEPSPFSGMKPPETPKITQHPLTRAGEAGNAASNLFSLDLGPPYGPGLFGVSWEPQYAEEWARSSLLRNGFNWPDGAVVILVGLKPLDASMNEAAFEAAQIPKPNDKKK
jgi:hypothetical protein